MHSTACCQQPPCFFFGHSISSLFRRQESHIVKSPSSLLANSSVERCHTNDLMPSVPISCLPPSRVDPEVQGLKVVIDCPAGTFPISLLFGNQPNL